MARYIKQDATTVPQINTELEKIELAIQDTLSRKGDTPNAMTAPLDMNGERLLNLPAPVADTDPLRKIDGEVYVTAAATSAAEALASENAAAQSATDSAQSANESAGSAAASLLSEQAALASELAAASTYDDFDDRYLGTKTSAPATDNDGDPLTTGALYYDSVLGYMQVYDSGWNVLTDNASSVAAAASAAAALASEIAAAASQSAALTSANNASNSASAALLSEQQADASEAVAIAKAAEASASATTSLEAKDYLESFLFHYITDDSTSVKVGIGTQVLVSESTTGYDSVILELHTS